MGFDANTLALLPQPFPFLVNPRNKQAISFDPESRKRVRTFFRIVNKLLDSSNKQPDADLILAHLNTLMTEINSAYFKGSNQDYIADPELLKYIEFKLAVETHLTEHHSVNMIAEQLAVNTSSLYGIVKEFAGVSPKEFMTNRLIMEAQRKLYYSNPSVKELAYELGFNDPSYFSRLFKKSVGKSVTEFSEEL